MTHFFDPENKLWRFIGKLFDSMFMGLLWFVCCLPVVTIGAATTAMYQYTLRQVNDTEGGIWRSFFKFFKARFKKATVIWLIQLGFGLFLAYDIKICWQMIDWNTEITGIKLAFLGVVIITLLFLMTSVYLYPILALFDFEVKKILSNSFIMAMANLPVSVTVLVVFVLTGLACYFLTPFTPFIVGLGVLLSSYFLFHVFDKYAVDDGEETAEDAESVE